MKTEVKVPLSAMDLPGQDGIEVDSEGAILFVCHGKMKGKRATLGGTFSAMSVIGEFPCRFARSVLEPPRAQGRRLLPDAALSLPCHQAVLRRPKRGGSCTRNGTA